MHQYFKIARSYHSKHKYDLVVVANPVSDFAIDWCFIDTLINWGIVDISQIGPFINHHYQWSKRGKEFVLYTMNLLEDKKNQFNDYQNTYDKAVSWLKQKLNSQEKIQNFDEIFDKTTDAKIVLDRCFQQGLIDANYKWLEKPVRLVALALHLKDNGYFFKGIKITTLHIVLQQKFEIEFKRENFYQPIADKNFDDFASWFPKKKDLF